MQLYGVINNLTDRAPPIIPAYNALGSSPIQAHQSVYDVLGRRFTVGIRVQL